MALSEIIFDATTYVQNWGRRDQIQTIIDKMRDTTGGLLGRREGAQLLGYLIADSLKGKPVGSFSAFPGMGITDDERRLLWRTQRTIDQLIHTCAVAATKNTPASILSVHPYSQYKYSIPLLDPVGLVNDRLRRRIVGSFVMTPPVRTLKDIELRNVPEFSREDELQSVQNVIEQMRSVGVEDTPDEIERSWLIQPPERPERVWARYVFSLAGAKLILLSMVQMIFQAFIADTLAVLDEDNVFHVGYLGRTGLGLASVVYYQPRADTAGIEYPDHIYVDLSDSALPAQGLYRVESSALNYSDEYGSRRLVAMRQCDSHLNPAPGLVSGFVQ